MRWISDGTFEVV